MGGEAERIAGGGWPFSRAGLWVIDGSIKCLVSRGALLDMSKKAMAWCRELSSSFPFPLDAFLKVS